VINMQGEIALWSWNFSGSNVLYGLMLALN